MTLTTHSIPQTLALGRLLGQLAPSALTTTLALDGQLGAGKTHLTRGIAEGAQVDDPSLVSSPTYVLLNIYCGPKPVFHLDAYRIASEEDFQAVGFDELLTTPGLVIVEWSDKIRDLLPPDRLHILIEHANTSDADTSTRTFTFTPTGTHSTTLLQNLLTEWEKTSPP